MYLNAESLFQCIFIVYKYKAGKNEADKCVSKLHI